MNLTWTITKEAKLKDILGWEERFLENQKNEEYIASIKRESGKDDLIYQQYQNKEETCK